jgi:hypothetical protein
MKINTVNFRPAVSAQTKIKSFNFHPAASVIRGPHKYLRTTTKEMTIMDTFKQFLQRKAATKRAELADVEAQAKRAEADAQRKKANTPHTPSIKKR